MKKLLFGMMAVAAMAVASCERSFDGAYYAGGGSAMVSVEVGMPDGVTRAFSEGNLATQLQYAVYEVNGGTLTLIANDDSAPGDPYKGEKTLVNRATKLSFTLLTDHTYGIVFWAAAEDAPYTVEFDTAGATMKYADDATLTANDDKLDAFWAYKVVDVKGDGSVSVTLKRPFAQINVGTSDYEKATTLGLNVAVSSISVKNAYTTLNLVNGEATDAQEMDFETSAIPSGETYPVTGYQYLAMAYVLVGKEQEVAEVTFGYGAEGAAELTTRTVGSVPLVRNHRTNIYGALLTSQLDVNVEVDGDTEGDKNVMLTWDGATKTEPARDEVTGAYTVNGADELAWLASQENADYEGETIILQNDLDLAGKEFPAFAAGTKRNGTGADGTSFKGVFDGNGKTISNFTTSMDFADDGSIAGFFTSVEGKDAVVKDVTFVNVEIAGGEQAGVVGIVSDGATVEGVVVKSGKVSGYKAAGGVVGRVLKSGTVQDCENHATVESKTTNAGGIIGAAYYTEEGSSMTITGCDNYGNVSGTSNSIGGIVGLCCGDVSDCENHGTITGGAASVGGIVGEQKSAGSVKGCTNYADVTGGPNYGAGGIVGWVRYESNDSYKKLAPVEVSGCVNEGKHITGYTGVGGIVGMWYCDGLCTENINFAETITAKNQFVAGIVGGTQWTTIDSNGSTTYGDLKLSVTYNTTYTEDANIIGKLNSDFIYDNTGGAHTVIENNVKGTVTTVSSAEDLKDALSGDNVVVVLPEGTSISAKGIALTEGASVTIKGNGNSSEISDFGYVGAKDCDITIEDVKLVVEKNPTNSTSLGFENAKNVTLKNVEFYGEFHTFTANAVFEKCHFYYGNGMNKARQGVWCDACGKTVIKDCVFEVKPDDASLETKAILVYSDINTDMGDIEVTNCTFKAGNVSEKAAVEIHSERFTKAGTITITNCTYDEDTYGGGLWREINNGTEEATNYYTVFVDGEKKSNN